MDTIGIIGPGQMGRGIAQVSAQAGYRVLLCGRDRDHARLAKSFIERSLSRLEERGKIAGAERLRIAERIEPVAGVTELSAAFIVIEAVPEVEATKVAVLESLRGTVKDSIVVSNTSSISITRLAKSAPVASRFLGLHFFNPAPVMQLVELICGFNTSLETAALAKEFAHNLGKTVVEVADSPGFIVNRLLIPLLNEATFALSERISTIEEIDSAVQLGLNHPMGPFKLADFIGLDTCLEICRTLYEGTGDQKFRPSLLLVKYVEAGWLGRKTGRGFYDYSTDPPRPTR